MIHPILGIFGAFMVGISVGLNFAYKQYYWAAGMAIAQIILILFFISGAK